MLERCSDLASNPPFPCDEVHPTRHFYAYAVFGVNDTVEIRENQRVESRRVAVCTRSEWRADILLE